jgi:hypothetical protein
MASVVVGERAVLVEVVVAKAVPHPCLVAPEHPYWPPRHDPNDPMQPISDSGRCSTR